MLLEAFGLGLLAQSSLFLAGLAVCWITVPTRIIGILAGFGAGALIAAIAFELLPEAQTGLSTLEFALWTLAGVAIFLIGDAVVEKRFGSDGAGASMGIVVGSVVDGVPESVIFGIQIGAGLTVSPSFLAAVFVSNIPQAIAPSADLRAAGWSACALPGCGEPSSSRAGSRPPSATSRHRWLPMRWGIAPRPSPPVASWRC